MSSACLWSIPLSLSCNSLCKQSAWDRRGVIQCRLCIKMPTNLAAPENPRLPSLPEVLVRTRYKSSIWWTHTSEFQHPGISGPSPIVCRRRHSTAQHPAFLRAQRAPSGTFSCLVSAVLSLSKKDCPSFLLFFLKWFSSYASLILNFFSPGMTLEKEAQMVLKAHIALKNVISEEMIAAYCNNVSMISTSCIIYYLTSH